MAAAVVETAIRSQDLPAALKMTSVDDPLTTTTTTTTTTDTCTEEHFVIGNYKVLTNQCLGQGSSGAVKLGYHRQTGRKVAVKIVSKLNLSSRARKRLANEIEILRKLVAHPKIISLLDVVEDSQNVYMVFDFVPTDVLSYLRKHGRLSEEIAFKIFSQLVEAVSYCHVNGICHRDIKIDNILLDPETFKIHLADFGFATYINPEEKIFDWCGSPYTVAPEIIKKKPYMGPPVDVWALGSVLFTLICGYYPFQGKDNKDALKRTVMGKMHGFRSGCGSRACRDLISRCLTADPEKRISLAHLRQHPFFWMHAEEEEEEGDEESGSASSSSSPSSGSENDGECENESDGVYVQEENKVACVESDVMGHADDDHHQQNNSNTEKNKDKDKVRRSPEEKKEKKEKREDTNVNNEEMDADTKEVDEAESGSSCTEEEDY
jgi:serine/threonine protein kinase